MAASAPSTPAETTAREQLHRLETLLQQVESFKYKEARALTRQIVQALMEFHGAAVEKMLDRIASSSESGVPLIDCLSKNDLVASLLLLYGLHPLDLDTRVRQALEKARPFLLSHGGNVELLGTADSIVRLRLQGSCHGCPSSAITLRQTIEEAIYEFAPDTLRIEVEEDTPAELLPTAEPATGRIALPILSH